MMNVAMNKSNNNHVDDASQPPKLAEMPQEKRDAELQHMQLVYNVFLDYRSAVLLSLAKRRADYRQLAYKYQHVMAENRYERHLEELKTFAEVNYTFLRKVLDFVNETGVFLNDPLTLRTDNSDDLLQMPTSSGFNMNKLFSTMQQLVRDWSELGSSERDSSYCPIIDAIETRFKKVRQDQRHNIRVCVPGAGLGRLAWNICKLGYRTEANEVSMFMLFVANFILNACQMPHEHTIHPFIHKHSNVVKYENQTRAVTIPDVDPSTLPKEHYLFSMVAGEFTEIYGDLENKSKWDCVATVFMLDTATNIIDYIQTIYIMLKPGGYWMNLGPLLYHFTNMNDEQTIELPLEEIMNIIRNFNFVIEEERMIEGARYTCDQASMLTYEYKCSYFVARKALD